MLASFFSLILLLSTGVDPLLIPSAPTSPPVLKKIVWPILRTLPPQGDWQPAPGAHPIQQEIPAMARSAGAAGVLWAIVRNKTIYLKLYRASDEHVLEVEAAPLDAQEGALREALRLQLGYLLSAPRAGGKRWIHTRPPLPPPPPPLSASTIAELATARPALPPIRPRPLVPSIEDPKAPPKPFQTEVIVRRREDAKRPKYSSDTVDNARGMPFSSTNKHQQRKAVGPVLRLGGTTRVGSDLAFGAALGLDVPVQSPWGVRFLVALHGTHHSMPIDNANVVDYLVGAGPSLRLWDGTTQGSIHTLLTYEQISVSEAIESTPTRRASLAAGAQVDWLIVGPLILGLSIDMIASPWTIDAYFNDQKLRTLGVFAGRFGLTLGARIPTTGL